MELKQSVFIIWNNKVVDFIIFFCYNNCGEKYDEKKKI